MKSKNYRIGNWVEFKKKQPYPYTTLQGSSFEGGCIENTFKPIKILNSWYDDFGLSKNDEGFYCFNGGRFVVVEMINSHCLFLDNPDDDNFKMELITGYNYVHEFQNLFFLLNGRDIKFKSAK